MTGLFSPRLLPRKTFTAEITTVTLDEFNLETEATEQFTLENCGLHPVTGWTLNTLPEGYRDKRAWHLYTTTPVSFIVEGENTKPLRVQVKPNLWAVAIKAEDWEYGLQSHTKLTLVEENER